MIKAIIVDFDGVLRRWPENDTLLEKEYGLPPGAIQNVAFDPNLLPLALRGEISDSKWRNLIVEKLQKQFPVADNKSAVRQWSKPAGVVDTQLLGLLLSCHLHNGLVLLTNATSRLNSDLFALGLDSTFSSVINSSEVGYVKPEVEIYQTAIRVCQCSVKEILFIDDTLANVAAASSMGISSHHYTGFDDCKNFLVTCSLIEN